MLRSEGKKIIMNECDYGLDLPFHLSGDILTTDKIIFSIKKSLYKDEKIIKKEFNNLVEEDGKLGFVLSFTEEETKLLPSGDYVYMIHQCRDCGLHNTIVNDGIFTVEKGCTP